MRAAILGLVLAALAGAAAAREASREMCVGIVDEGGHRLLKAYQSLDLLHGDPSGPLPAPPSGQLLGVMCARNALAPTLADYRVLRDLHVPLYITDRRRTVVLEIAGGRMQVRVKQGSLTQEEARLTAARLTELQRAFARAS